MSEDEKVYIIKDRDGAIIGTRTVTPFESEIAAEKVYVIKDEDDFIYGIYKNRDDARHDCELLNSQSLVKRFLVWPYSLTKERRVVGGY